MLQRESLTTLDEVLTRIETIVREHSDAAFEAELETWLEHDTGDNRREEVKERLRPRFRVERHVEIKLDEHRSVRAKSFADAKTHPEVLNTDPRGFEACVKGFETRVVISASELGLSLDLSPNVGPMAERIFGIAMSWITDNRPSRLREKWAMLGGLQWVLLFFFLVLLGAVTFTTVNTESGLDALQAEAETLLVDGVTEEEEVRALEILLAITSSSYEKATSEIHISPLFYLFSALGLFVAVLLSFAPRTALSLGRGEARIRRSLRIERILFYTLPLMLLSGLVLPLIRVWAFRG